MQQIVHRQRDRPLHMSADLQPELRRVDGRGNVGEVPANIEAVIGCEHALIEDFKRGLEQRWTYPLQNQRALLRKVARELTPSVGERQLDEATCPGRPAVGTEQSCHTQSSGPCKEVAPRPRRARKQSLHGQSSCQRQTRLGRTELRLYHQHSAADLLGTFQSKYRLRTRSDLLSSDLRFQAPLVGSTTESFQVFVHGAWAGGSSWSEVIQRRQATGLHV